MRLPAKLAASRILQTIEGAGCREGARGHRHPVPITAKADLTKAYLLGAKLSGADLSEANFNGADLSGATNLSGAKNLTQEQIDSAIGNRMTILPEGLKRPASWSSEAPSP